MRVARERTSKVLHVGAAETLTGVAREQLRRLRDRGWEVEVACAPDGWEQGLVDEGFAVRPIRLAHRGSPVRALNAIPDLLRHIRRARPALVHTHNAEHGVLGRHSARLLGVPSVHTWRYDPLDAANGAAQRAVYALAEAAASRAGTAVLFQNREDMARVTKNRIVPGSRAKFVGNGIVIERFLTPSRPVGHIRRDLGLEEDETMVLCVARLQARKGQVFLIDAVAELLPRHPRLRLVLVGTGPDEPMLRTQSSRRGDRVSFLGHRGDVPDLIHAADIVCLPSEREGLPRAVLEARAAGRAIIATDVVGTREALTHEVTGLLVPFGDSAALAAALEQLLSQPERAAELGREGQRRLREEDWDEDSVVDRVSNIYASIIGHSP